MTLLAQLIAKVDSLQRRVIYLENRLRTERVNYSDLVVGHLTPRMWLSKKPGGKPLDQKGADVRGQGAKLSWTQADSGRGVVLERGKIYYLNHQLLAIGEGKGPTARSSFIRNASTGGKP